MYKVRHLGLAALVAAAWCLTSSTARAAVDAKLLPPKTEVVLTINFKQILGSELVKGQKELIDQIKAGIQNKIPDDQAAKYIKDLGFDPFTDLHSITVAHTGSKDIEDLFIAVEGKFDAAKLEAVAKDAAKDNGEALRISKFGKVTVYEVHLPGDKTGFVALIGKTLVITPTADAMKATIARASGSQPVAPKVRDLLKTTNDRQSLSVVLTGAALTKLIEEGSKATGKDVPDLDKLGGIEGVSAAITVSKNINFQIGVGAKDGATAKEMMKAGNQGLDAARGLLAAMGDEKLAPVANVLSTLKLTSIGNNTVLTGEISYENLEKLIKLGGQFRKKGN